MDLSIRGLTRNVMSSFKEKKTSKQSRAVFIVLRTLDMDTHYEGAELPKMP